MITMKKENWKAVINFIITVLTAITSAFCVSSCQCRHPYPGTEGDDGGLARFSKISRAYSV